MKRTTVFLTDALNRQLHEAARRTHRPQAEIIREALTRYFDAQTRPWPRSIGMGKDTDPSVTSENVKEWVREQWLRRLEQDGKTGASAPPC